MALSRRCFPRRGNSGASNESPRARPQSANAEPFQFGAVVVVRSNAWTEKQGIAGFTGVISGVDELDDDVCVTVNEDDDSVWMIPRDHVWPTGAVIDIEHDPESVSIRVDSDGALVETDEPSA